MKATDLMIGDWVQFSYRHPETDERVVRVFQITQIEAQLGDYYIWSEKNGRVCHPEWLQPIPLTPEILEKNGFIIKHPESEKRTYWRDYAGQIVGHKNRGLMLMEIHGNPKKFGYFIPYFKGHLYYVHELQHALRLCGIEKEVEL